MDPSTAPNGADSPATPPNKVIFFDLDDTLMDRDTARLAGMQRLKDVYGPDVPTFAARTPESLVAVWAKARDVCRERRRKSPAETETRMTLTRTFWTMVCGGSAAADGEEEEEGFHCPSYDELEACWRTFKDAYDDHVCAMPGAARALRKLRDAGYAIGVITNGHTVPQRWYLRKIGLQHLINGVVDLDTRGIRPKPHPEMFKVAIRRFEAPPGAVMVGDSWHNDVCASRGVGLTPVWFVPEGREETAKVERRLRRSPRVKRIRNFEELLEHLGVE